MKSLTSKSPLLLAEPLRGAHGAEGEAPAAARAVGQLDRVERGVQQERVRARLLPAAHGGEVKLIRCGRPVQPFRDDLRLAHAPCP